MYGRRMVNGRQLGISGSVFKLGRQVVQLMALLTRWVEVALLFLVYRVHFMKEVPISVTLISCVISTAKRAQVDSRYDFCDP